MRKEQARGERGRFDDVLNIRSIPGSRKYSREYARIWRRRVKHDPEMLERYKDRNRKSAKELRVRVRFAKLAKLGPNILPPDPGTDEMERYVAGTAKCSECGACSSKPSEDIAAQSLRTCLVCGWDFWADEGL